MNYESIVLVGDFMIAAHHQNSDLRLQLHDLVNTFNLAQLVNEPTYLTPSSANILDPT